MKRFFLIVFLICVFSTAFARHIVGGEIIYDFLSSTATTKTYRVTVRLFRDAANCDPAQGCADLPPYVKIGVFNNDNNQLALPFIDADQTDFTEMLPIILQPPCLTNAPAFHYQAGYYTFDVTLPNNAAGYTLTYQTCCRVNSITNGGQGEGVTYLGEIAGLNTLINGINDNSARFATGISIICYHKAFKLDFSATDPDNQDVLEYSFINALNSPGITNSTPTNQPNSPPYSSIGYSAGFSGANPFGNGSTIDPNTGIISGIAPDAGTYVISVVVKSYRNGLFVAQHRKDFLVTVAPCDFASAELDLTHSTCDGLTVNFQNNNTSLLNLTYNWDFADPASGAANTSNLEFPSHTYTIPGDYNVRLIVNAGTPCADTAYSLQRVWPGFNPAFAPIPPTCKDVPVHFDDATTTSFPPVTYWRWDFGDQTVTNDTSHLQHATYVYHTAGTYNAEFIVQTEKGCIDTLYPVVKIVDKPDFFLSHDTLICTADTLLLHSNVTTGTITWSPDYMISDIHSFNPLVSPDVPTLYTVTYSDPSGCTTSATVFINVVNGVTLSGLNDTTICRTDTAKLVINTNALYFAWTPANLIIDSTAQNPMVIPTGAQTVFHVVASISAKCFSEKDIAVRTVPYPVPLAFGDGQICYGKDAQLHATGGSSYLWTPPAYLNNVAIPNPVSVAPKVSLTYTVQVNDTLGCPKPSFATFRVNVIRLFANAGPQDTSIVLGQPLQLDATNAVPNLTYTWSPATYLSTTNGPRPVANPTNNITYTVQLSNEIGCSAQDTIHVRVYFLDADIYVPSAFTPTGDGNNDIFRPIALGILSIQSFQIYTRWGELIFETSKIGEGWDGKYKGYPQPPATYIWQARATNYKGEKIFRKGTVILVR